MNEDFNRNTSSSTIAAIVVSLVGAARKIAQLLRTRDSRFEPASSRSSTSLMSRSASFSATLATVSKIPCMPSTAHEVPLLPHGLVHLKTWLAQRVWQSPFLLLAQRSACLEQVAQVLW